MLFIKMISCAHKEFFKDNLNVAFYDEIECEFEKIKESGGKLHKDMFLTFYNTGSSINTVDEHTMKKYLTWSLSYIKTNHSDYSRTVGCNTLCAFLLTLHTTMNSQHLTEQTKQFFTRNFLFNLRVFLEHMIVKLIQENIKEYENRKSKEMVFKHYLLSVIFKLRTSTNISFIRQKYVLFGLYRITQMSIDYYANIFDIMQPNSLLNKLSYVYTGKYIKFESVDMESLHLLYSQKTSVEDIKTM